MPLTSVTYRLYVYTSWAHKGKERSTVFFQKRNCAALAHVMTFINTMCMIILTDVCTRTQWRNYSRNHWPGLQQEACLQDTVPPLVAEEHTFRTYRSNSSTSSSSSHTCLTFFFVTLIPFFNFGFSCDMNCCCHSSLRHLMPFSAFVLKVSGARQWRHGVLFTLSAVHDVRIVVRLLKAS